MTGLMRADGYKLRKSRSLKVCLIVAFLLGILMAVLYHVAYQMLGDQLEATKALMAAFGSDEKTVNEMLMIVPQENLWAYINTALADTNLLYIAAVAVSIFVGSEYSMGTIRNAVSRGFDRTAVYGSKLLFSLLIMLSVAAAYVLGSGLVGAVLYGFSADVDAGTILLLSAAYLAEMAAAGCFYVMIAVLMKSTGHAIAFSLVIPLLVSSVLQIVLMAYNNSDIINRLWLFQTMTATRQLCLYGEAYVPFLAAAVYAAVSCLTGWLVFRRQELK